LGEGGAGGGGEGAGGAGGGAGGGGGDEGGDPPVCRQRCPGDGRCGRARSSQRNAWRCRIAACRAEILRSSAKRTAAGQRQQDRIERVAAANGARRDRA